MNMYQFLEQTAKDVPDSLFLIREKITYAQFLSMVHARATTLHKNGIKAGDVVGVLSHNLPEFPLTLFAIWYLGAKVLMLDTNLTEFEYEKMTEITNCTYVCAEKSFFYDSHRIKFIDITLKDDGVDKKLKPVNVLDGEIATMSFTSGSTGIPKVVPLTHSNLLEAAKSMEDFNSWIKQGEVMYGFLPLYHIFGFAIGILAPLYYKMGIVLQPTVNPKSILDDFKTFKPHVIPAVPRLWEMFRNKIISGIKDKRMWWFVSFVFRR
ncbi:MAG: acyl--CoA ligase, partial [Alphaproteobacteria bacterium]|nr:acyl--CoA ligase [Alphaproteobacteria bacterium]